MHTLLALSIFGCVEKTDKKLKLDTQHKGEQAIMLRLVTNFLVRSIERDHFTEAVLESALGALRLGDVEPSLLLLQKGIDTTTWNNTRNMLLKGPENCKSVAVRDFLKTVPESPQKPVPMSDSSTTTKRKPTRPMLADFGFGEEEEEMDTSSDKPAPAAAGKKRVPHELSLEHTSTRLTDASKRKQPDEQEQGEEAVTKRARMNGE